MLVIQFNHGWTDDNRNSTVVHPNSVTTLQLVCFDGGIEFLESFLKISPQVPPKNVSVFSRGQNLKWLPGITETSNAF